MMKKQISAWPIRLFASLLLATSLLGQTAWAAPTLVPVDGRTTVTLSTDLLTALNTLGVAPGTVGDGTLRSGVASFPITGGVLDLENAKGEINHTGGLSLTAGRVRVELSSFNIDTSGARPVLTGLVTANGSFVGRIPLFNLELPALTLPLQPPAFNTLFLSGVRLTLAAEAAQALNGAFGVTAFAAGFNVGTATVFAIGSPERRRPFFGRAEVGSLEN